MKGLIFTEFLEMAEKEYGLAVVDKLVIREGLASNGVYTSVGTYDFKEMVILITGLHEESGDDIEDLFRVFGRYLFRTLTKNYKDLIDCYEHPLDLLEKLQTHIHVEVKKIYPMAELPEFIPQRKSKDHLVLDYYSPRKLHFLAESMMQECLLHFHRKGTIQSCDLKNGIVRFDIRIHDR